MVVYKINRLLRPLEVFSTLVEVFDRNSVTFVSVTPLVLSRLSSGLFRAMFGITEIKNGTEIHRRVSP